VTGRGPRTNRSRSTRSWDRDRFGRWAGHSPASFLALVCATRRWAGSWWSLGNRFCRFGLNTSEAAFAAQGAASWVVVDFSRGRYDGNARAQHMTEIPGPVYVRSALRAKRRGCQR